MRLLQLVPGTGVLRSGLGAFGALAFGAGFSAFGVDGSMRQLVPPPVPEPSGGGPGSPTVLLGELMNFFLGLTLASRFADEAPACACDCCQGGPPPIPAELEVVLKRMRFPYLRRAAPEVLATARSQRWDPAEVVRILLEAEIKGRDEATRRNHRKQAQLPSGKTFESWKEGDSSIPVPTQHALMTLEWISRAENLACAGPSGTGKSHLAEALANKAIDEGMKVSWFTLESLTAHLGRATVDNTVSKAVAKITRSDLIVVDDIGMLPSGQAAAEAFYRVIDAAYERRSVIVTSNLHPSGFDSIMPKTLATAAVDRLLHHAHIVLTEGSSLRLTQATTGQGVQPLDPAD